MENNTQHIIEALKKYHDARFTPAVYEHSVFGRAAMLLEKEKGVDTKCDCCRFHAFRIPVSPEIVGDGYDQDGNLVYDTGYCPICRTAYEIECDTPKFCENCGQALDWDTALTEQAKPDSHNDNKKEADRKPQTLQTSIEILNFYRNRYYNAPSGTVEYQLANALNDVLPLIARYLPPQEKP